MLPENDKGLGLISGMTEASLRKKHPRYMRLNFKDYSELKKKDDYVLLSVAEIVRACNHHRLPMSIWHGDSCVSMARVSDAKLSLNLFKNIYFDSTPSSSLFSIYVFNHDVSERFAKYIIHSIDPSIECVFGNLFMYKKLMDLSD